MNAPSELTNGPAWLRSALKERDDYAEKIKPIPGIGTSISEAPDGRAINAQPGGSAAPAPEHPLQVTVANLGTSEAPDWRAKVELDSDLFKSRKWDDKIEITGLDSWFPLAGPSAANDRIWLEGDFVNGSNMWPAIQTAEIQGDGAGGDWGDGEIEGDGEDLPTQTKFRRVIAVIEWADGLPIVDQRSRNHLRLEAGDDAGMPIVFPEEV